MTPNITAQIVDLINRSRAMSGRITRVNDTLFGQQPTTASEATISQDVLNASYYSVEEMLRNQLQEVSNQLYEIEAGIERQFEYHNIEGLREIMQGASKSDCNVNAASTKRKGL